jgi:hypothetical protein
VALALLKPVYRRRRPSSSSPNAELRAELSEHATLDPDRPQVSLHPHLPHSLTHSALTRYRLEGCFLGLIGQGRREPP